MTTLVSGNLYSLLLRLVLSYRVFLSYMKNIHLFVYPGSSSYSTWALGLRSGDIGWVKAKQALEIMWRLWGAWCHLMPRCQLQLHIHLRPAYPWVWTCKCWGQDHATREKAIESIYIFCRSLGRLGRMSIWKNGDLPFSVFQNNLPLFAADPVPRPEDKYILTSTLEFGEAALAEIYLPQRNSRGERLSSLI